MDEKFIAETLLTEGLSLLGTSLFTTTGLSIHGKVVLLFCFNSCILHTGKHMARPPGNVVSCGSRSRIVHGW